MSSPESRWFRAVLLLLLPAIAEVAGGKIPAVIVFGDSTVDAGNNNAIGTLLKSNFLPYGRDFPGRTPTGRFCNGRLPTDFISEALGLPPLVPAYLDPNYGIQDFARGVCFASAGTGLDNATSDVLSVIPLWMEVEYFKEYGRRLRKYAGNTRAEEIIKEAIYVVSVGTNDFLENYFAVVTGRWLEFTVQEYQDFLVRLAAEFVGDIYRLGARKISFAGLAAIGCLPLERTANVIAAGECNEKYNEAARGFNVKLQAMIRQLSNSLPDLKLRYGDLYDHFVDLIRNPSRYGIENVMEGCCATGKFEMSYLCKEKNLLTCADADKFFFWDAFHPTEKINRIFANLTLTTTIKHLL